MLTFFKKKQKLLRLLSAVAQPSSLSGNDTAFKLQSREQLTQYANMLIESTLKLYVVGENGLSEFQCLHVTN